MKIKIALFVLISVLTFSEDHLIKPESMTKSNISGKINLKLQELTELKAYKTTGSGFFSGNPLYGKVLKNELGYPKREYGLNHLLGFSYTWIYDQPDDKKIKNAIRHVYDNNNYYNLTDEQIKMKIKKELDKNVLNYFTLGTVLAVAPLNIEYGWMFLSEDNNIRTRVGFGLPTLICFGISTDF